MHEENGKTFYYSDKMEKIYRIKPISEKLGQEPAFPSMLDVDARINPEWGMSKRLVIATEAMKALLSRSGFYWQGDGTLENLNGLLPDFTAELAYQYADALLKQEND